MIRRPATLMPAALVVALSSGLAGCFDTNGIQTSVTTMKGIPLWMNLEVISLTTTHKTMYDHVATYMTGQDCSSPRAERGDAYCVGWPQPPAPPPEVYCYSTLARANCFSQPYTQVNDHLIGFVPASIQTR